MEFLNAFLPLMIYFVLIILIIVGIFALIKLIITLDKLDKVIDDVSEKINKVNPIFDFIGLASGRINFIIDKVSNVLEKLITKVNNKRKENYDE